MKNRSIIALLTVIAVLLGANLLVTVGSAAWAQERPVQPVRPQERQPERPQTPQTPQRPQVPPDRERVPDRGIPQRAPRCVGITSVGNVIVLAFDDGSVETRAIPQPR